MEETVTLKLETYNGLMDKVVELKNEVEATKKNGDLYMIALLDFLVAAVNLSENNPNKENFLQDAMTKAGYSIRYSAHGHESVWGKGSKLIQLTSNTLTR